MNVTETSLRNHRDPGLRNVETSVLAYMAQSVEIFRRSFVVIPTMLKGINSLSNILLVNKLVIFRDMQTDG